MGNKRLVGNLEISNSDGSNLVTHTLEGIEVSNDSGDYTIEYPNASGTMATLENIPNEVYVGDGDMPEDATIQIIMDAADEEQILKDELTEYIDSKLVSGSGVSVVQETGDSETAVMSQKAVTEAINGLGFEGTREFNPPDILKGLSLTRHESYLWVSTGLTFYENRPNYTSIGPLIDVLEGHTYLIPKFYGYVRLYDETGQGGTQLNCVDDPKGIDFEFTIPEGLTKIGISYAAPTRPVNNMYRLTMTEEEEREASRVTNEHFSLNPNNVCSEGAKLLIAPLKDKIIVNFGDSIFGNARPPEDISTRLSELTGATVYNCGFGGCRMAYHPYANFDAFSMTKLADAITSKDFTLQETALTTTVEGSTVPQYFAETVELMKTIDFSNVDIITIAYGTNDFNGVTLDGDDINTFGGALRYSIETILSSYPQIKIFICSQTYRFWMDSNYAFVEDSDTKVGGNAYTMIELLEKTKEIAAEYKLPYIDNYYALGINKFNRGYYFPPTDGTHHNIEGRRLIAAHMAKELF